MKVNLSKQLQIQTLKELFVESFVLAYRGIEYDQLDENFKSLNDLKIYLGNSFNSEIILVNN